MSRLAAVAVVFLSLGFLVNSSPIAAPAASTELITLEERTSNCYGGYCYGGLDLVTLLLQLQAAIEYKLSLLDSCLGGGDYAAIIYDIEGLLLAASGAISGYKIGLLGLLTGKLLVIAKIWAAIAILCLLSIVRLGGLFGGFIGICGGLFTKVHIGLLLKIKFGLCLGALGLGGY
ncbi:hypothetical protein BDV93DRAFT_512966 [Ceratobasidium sp. AG-I]|nr:hypothetical protein BDV93DRAFT_512966 [Ceratobasidium sp. AG-I]